MEANLSDDPPPSAAKKPNKIAPLTVGVGFIAILAVSFLYEKLSDRSAQADTSGSNSQSTSFEDLKAVAFLATHGGSENGHWSVVDKDTIQFEEGVAFVWRSPKNRCLFRFQTMIKPYWGLQLDFSKLSSYYTVNPWNSSQVRVTFEGVHGAYCAGKNALARPPIRVGHTYEFVKNYSDNCSREYDMIVEAGSLEMTRMIQAVSFIRSNFCPGLPEKPY